METRSRMSRSLHTNRDFEKLEPYEGKPSRTVLRGEEGSNALDLPDICMFKPEAVREEFALPANVEPVNILLIGYGDGPAADPNRHDTLRKPLSATVFHERF